MYERLKIIYYIEITVLLFYKSGKTFMQVDLSIVMYGSSFSFKAYLNFQATFHHKLLCVHYFWPLYNFPSASGWRLAATISPKHCTLKEEGILPTHPL